MAGDVLDALVVGGGQSGLAVGKLLVDAGLQIAIADAGAEVGHVWRSRWESLRLFTPVEHDALPGLPFPGAPGTHPGKDDVADYLQMYATAFDLPVLTRTRVLRLTRGDGVFTARTPRGALDARAVVVATGPFARPVVPALARGLAQEVVQLHSAQYRRPQDLPGGHVLVVGGGNSGVQLAHELAATRRVTLAVGERARMVPQHVLGRDLFWWLTRAGLMEAAPDSFVGRRMRARELVIGTSRRSLRRRGVVLRPRLVGAEGRRVRFADGRTEEVEAVLWATGFAPDVGWIDVPGAVEDGVLAHRRGVTDVPGLYALGMPWQRSRGSALLGFVGRDAADIAAHVVARHQERAGDVRRAA